MNTMSMPEPRRRRGPVRPRGELVADYPEEALASTAPRPTSPNGRPSGIGTGRRRLEHFARGRRGLLDRPLALVAVQQSDLSARRRRNTPPPPPPPPGSRLMFVFAAFSSVVSVLTEMISRFLGLRGEYLLRGLRTLLDGGGKFALPWRDILKIDYRARARGRRDRGYDGLRAAHHRRRVFFQAMMTKFPARS